MLIFNKKSDNEEEKKIEEATMAWQRAHLIRLINDNALCVFISRKSILYRRLYLFSQRYDIFRVLVNIDVPFQDYR